MVNNKENIRNGESYNTRSWSDLHPDLLILVAKKIQFIEDYYAFRACCTSWRSFGKEYIGSENQLPRVFQIKGSPDNQIERTSANKTLIYSLGWNGWILEFDGNLEVCLLHVFSQRRIKLPSHSKNKTSIFCIKSAALSSDPITTPLNYTLMVISHNSELAFWRHGDKNFTDFKAPARFSEIIFFNGFFYSINGYGDTFKFDGADPKIYVRVAKGPSQLLYGLRAIPFLLESGGELLLVIMSDYLMNKKFHAYKVPNGSDEWIEIKDLGGRAIFVGCNTSFSVDTSETSWCTKNCVYFTPHHLNNPGPDYFTIIYNLVDGTSRIARTSSSNEYHPPLWVI